MNPATKLSDEEWCAIADKYEGPTGDGSVKAGPYEETHCAFVAGFLACRAEQVAADRRPGYFDGLTAAFKACERVGAELLNSGEQDEAIGAIAAAEKIAKMRVDLLTGKEELRMDAIVNAARSVVTIYGGPLAPPALTRLAKLIADFDGS